MNWRRNPQPTKTIRIGDRAILTVPDDMTPDAVRDLVHRFEQARRTNGLIVMGPGMTYTPLPPRRHIRLAQTERWLTT